MLLKADDASAFIAENGCISFYCGKSYALFHHLLLMQSDASVSIAETGASISNLLKASESVYVTEHRFLSSCR